MFINLEDGNIKFFFIDIDCTVIIFLRISFIDFIDFFLGINYFLIDGVRLFFCLERFFSDIF